MDVIGHPAQQGLEVIRWDENPLGRHELVIAAWRLEEGAG
jgi:hypothetical protein